MKSVDIRWPKNPTDLEREQQRMSEYFDRYQTVKYLAKIWADRIDAKLVKQFYDDDAR